jgi:hypothetical protein
MPAKAHQAISTEACPGVSLTVNMLANIIACQFGLRSSHHTCMIAMLASNVLYLILLYSTSPSSSVCTTNPVPPLVPGIKHSFSLDSVSQDICILAGLHSSKTPCVRCFVQAPYRPSSGCRNRFAETSSRLLPSSNCRILGIQNEGDLRVWYPSSACKQTTTLILVGCSSR